MCVWGGAVGRGWVLVLVVVGEHAQPGRGLWGGQPGVRNRARGAGYLLRGSQGGGLQAPLPETPNSSTPNSHSRLSCGQTWRVSLLGDCDSPVHSPLSGPACEAAAVPSLSPTHCPPAHSTACPTPNTVLGSPSCRLLCPTPLADGGPPHEAWSLGTLRAAVLHWKTDRRGILSLVGSVQVSPVGRGQVSEPWASVPCSA